MASLNMGKSLPFDRESITKYVEKEKIGNYALGKMDGQVFRVSYVGRSDTDLRKRLLNHIDEPYTHFKYSYATSKKAAFEKECKNFHDFNPPDNSIHPDRPEGTDWKCPLCSRFDE